MKWIVVPVADTTPKCQEYLDNLLTSIKRGGYLENDYHVLLCYDKCAPEFIQYFRDKYKGEKIADWTDDRPARLNFAANSNIGIREAMKLGAEYVVVLNMDTILPPHWHFKHLLREGLSFPNPVDDPTIELSKSGPNHVWEPEVTPVTKWSGFCMVLNRSVIEKIGVLDERFKASFEDDDICARAALAGFPVELVNIRVHHELKDRTTPSNTGAYDIQDLGIHLNIFRRKWSIPYQIQHEQFNQWILDNYTWNEVFFCP